MTDKHINMRPHEVLALLDGRKVQHREAIKLPKKTFSGGPIYERPDMGGWEQTMNGGGGCFKIIRGERVSVPETVGMWHKTTGMCFDAPYQAGNRLWVRESFVLLDDCKIAYVTSNATNAAKDYDIREAGFKIKPSIHMPRWASRLTLIVESVKIERVQEISEEDAIAEGVRKVAGFFQVEKPDGMTAGGTSARAAYALLWDSLNAKRAPWSGNPWVCAISFRVIKANIDAAEGEV